MKLLVVNGPNLNLLGVREPGIYGDQSYAALVKLIEDTCAAENIQVDVFQSNHEGAIVDRIQAAIGSVDGIVINPAAYTHTSVAKREDFRQISYARLACVRTIMGQGLDGYRQAILFLKDYLENADR